MVNKFKYTCLIGSFIFALSIVAGYKVFTNHHHDKPTEVSLLDYRDRNNLDNSIKHLFEGKSERVVCGIIGDNRSNYEDYDNEIKKYCSKYGIKTSFIHEDDGNINAVTLKR